MSKIFRAPDRLRKLYPGFVQMSVSPFDTGTLTSFHWPPECLLTGALRQRILARSRAWPVCPEIDPQNPDLPRPGWGQYVYADAAPSAPDAAFPRGIGVCWDTTGGGKMFLIVVMQPFLVRLVDNDLDISIEQRPLWAANFPPMREEPGALGNRPLTFLAEAIRDYVRPHGITAVSIATKGGHGGSAARLLRHKTQVVESLLYGNHSIDIVELSI